MKNVCRISLCILFANITLFGAPQSLREVYDYLEICNNAQIAFNTKKTVATKTKLLLAKTRLLHVAKLHCDNPDVSAEKKEHCLFIIRSFLAGVSIKTLIKFGSKTALEQQVLHHK